jgi:uncharacterized protein (TIGR03435 family)
MKRRSLSANRSAARIVKKNTMVQNALIGRLVAWVFAAGVALAQPTSPQSTAAAARSAFEVASIRLHPDPITFSADPSVHGAGVVGTASTILDLIEEAYELRGDQISGGPTWVKSDHYDIAAKAEGESPITKGELRQMLRSLLADRFQLKFRRERRETAVYELVLGKGVPKLKPPDVTGHGFVEATSSGLHMEASNGSMAQLATQLSVTAGRPVIDKTGLAEHYAYKLDWFPANRDPEPDSNVPNMFTAVQEQLGLKLESGKAQIEMFVIDHVEKPSEN